MKIHVLFTEPANYTQDLIANVYEELNIRYSFIHGNSIATNDVKIISSAQHLFSSHSLFKNMLFLWRCTKEHKLIISHGYNHIYFIFLWFFSFLRSCYIGIESDTPFYPKKGIKGLIKTIYLRLIFANKHILGLPGGTGTHRNLFLNYGMPDERIFFMPMMVDNKKYETCNESVLVPHTRLKFLFVGRLVADKDPILLVRAFKSLLEKRYAAELVLVGDGNLRPQLEELIAETDHIRLAGKKFGSDLLQEYRDAHVLVLPSNFEPWGLVVNEALAAGLPVICNSAVGAALDLVVKPDTGWLFDNEEELIAKMVYAIAHPEEVSLKAQRGWELMHTYWNYDLYRQNLYKVSDYVQKN